MTVNYSNLPVPTDTPKWMRIVGWILTALPALVFVGGGIFAIVNPSMMKGGFKEKGWPEDVAIYIAITEVVCGILYLIPQTAVLGAVLLTGYLGGATGVHVRIKEAAWFAPIIFGIVVWLGLFFRDARVRALLPIRKP